VFADLTVRGGNDWVTGSNTKDRHVTGANVGRDFRVDRWEDLVEFREGDRCPIDGGELRIARAIVLGHIYQLGTKYSAPLDATFVDEDDALKPYVMGSYGIGITRIMAAAVEQRHDELGIIWPKIMAPFDVELVVATMDYPLAMEAAMDVYDELVNMGLDVLVDDREERAGVKFADADLIGIPVQLVFGKRGLGRNLVDVKVRATGSKTQPRLDETAAAARDALASAP
jgi:prolyl-tRNA synthetase